ncbi:MAG: ATP-binding protein [Lachnospiraceae bacterium]|nr:ATP-binding protein [Lachnospiraceae bacterium]
MHATEEVRNCNGKIVGFVIDGKYETYSNVFDNIKWIENLKINSQGIIESIEDKLPIIDKREINLRIYSELCKENPYERDIQKQFEEWKKYFSNLALYVKGARQIGKTTELKKFAYKNYENIVYINLSDIKERKEFEKVCNSNSIRFAMMNYCKEMGQEDFEDIDNTILVIDEIQESVNVYNSIRKLRAELKCKIALSGSYLGVTLNKEYFLPVGDLCDVEMLSLSFSEFCRLYGADDILMNINLYGEGNDEDYKKLTKLYRIYREIGGYPAVIKEYLIYEDVEKCHKVLEYIINKFTDESSRYFNDDKCAEIFRSVYTNTLLNMSKEKKGSAAKDIETITEFVKKSTKLFVSRDEVNKAMSWLVYSHILGTCNLINQGNVYEILYDRRCYFMDCGIANHIAKNSTISNSDIDGLLAENFVYTELYRLYKNSNIKGDKPCCSIYGNYELDFMIVDENDNKLGIEVKNSNSNNPISLIKFLEDKKIDEGYIAGVTRGGVRKEYKAIPIYTVGCRFPY